MKKQLAFSWLLVSLLLPGLAGATTYIVDPAGGGDYTTITTAMAAASNGDVIFVRRIADPSKNYTYTENVNLKAGVTLRGEEAAGTILGGTVNLSEEGATLERFTIKGTVNLNKVSAAVIQSNIFYQTSSVALSISPDTGQTDAGVKIRGNTFYKNTAKAIDVTAASSAEISFNIFYGNGTAIARTAATWTTITTNVFFNNTTNVSSGSVDVSSNSTSTDPKFLDMTGSTVDLTGAAIPDLHITRGSPACGRGAYASGAAGASPDTTPAPPADITSDFASGSVRVSWTHTLACDSPVSKFYLKWNDTASTTASDYAFLGEVSAGSGTSHSATFDPSDPKFGTAPAPPSSAPTNVTASPLDSAIQVSWSGVTGAAGYRVKWGTSAGALDQEADAGNVSSYKVTGLSNNTTYYAAVAAYNANSIYVVVTALPDTTATTESDWESRPSSSLKIPANESAPTAYTPAATAATPSKISGYPDLEDKGGGCFVTTLDGKGDRKAPGAAAWPLALLAAAGALAAGLRRLPKGAFLGMLLAAALLLPNGARAADRPWWVVSASGGVFYPRIEGWSDNYDKKYVWEGKLGLGFRLLRWLEIGAEGGYRKAEGSVDRFDNGTQLTTSIDQTLTVYPVQAYVLVQFLFSDRQWLVPYVAGGYSRYYYKKEIEGADDARGHQDGYHARGGLKLSLDALDPYYADRSADIWLIKKTYFSIEAQYAKVDDRGDSNTNLGGMSYLAGFVVEF